MMSKLVLVFTFILISIEPSRSIEIRNNTEARAILCKNLNKPLHDISTTLVKALKLDKNFTNVNKNNSLIKIVSALIEVSETKFKMYEEIHNATKNEIDNKAINPLFNLAQVIEEIFKEEHYFLRNNTFLRNNSLIGFYEAVKSDSNWLEKLLNDWEDDDNNSYTEHRRKNSAKYLRRKYKDKVYKILRRRGIDDLPPWRAPNQTILQSRRLLGSHPAQIQRYPFVASLLLSGKFVCAASIISKDLVLTAASCLQLAYKNLKFFDKRDAAAVRVGSDYPTQGGEVIPITTIYFHSSYDPVHLYDNLAIGRLESPLDFMRARKRVSRIEFERADVPLPDRTAVSLIGWGDQNNKNFYNGPLTMATLETYSLSSCQKIYSPEYVTVNDFCAGFADMETGACYRDVGGPGFIDSYLIGVVSFGSPVCGTPNGPTVFTRIGNYASWIDSVIEKVRQINTENVTSVKYYKSLRERNEKTKKSAYELLTGIFHDLKLDILLNASFKYQVQPTESTHNEIFSLKGGNPSKDILKFWEEPKSNNERIIYVEDPIYTVPNSKEENIIPIEEPISTVPKSKEEMFIEIQEPIYTIPTTTSLPEVTESDLAHLVTLPKQDDIDPEVMKQLVAIKEVLSPLFVTTQSPFKSLSYVSMKPNCSKTTARYSAKISKNYKNYAYSTRFRSNTEPIEGEPIEEDSNVSFSGRNKNKMPILRTNQAQELLNNWDLSTNELFEKSDTDEEYKYEKRRLTSSRQILNRVKKKNIKNEMMIRVVEAPEFKTDFNMPKDKLGQVTRRDSSKVKAMILTALDTNVRDRDLEHYQTSEEENWDDEPTRRLLNYVIT